MKKYEIDVAAIRGIMGEKGINNSMLAEQIGINRNTLRIYFQDPKRMPYNTIIKIVSTLEIPEDRIGHIFFKEKLTKNAS